MENITIIEIEEHGKVVDYVLIDRGNNEFTSMTKAEYDRRQAEQSTPIVIDEAEAK
jgi:hypothetical protein